MENSRSRKWALATLLAAPAVAMAVARDWPQLEIRLQQHTQQVYDEAETAVRVARGTGDELGELEALYRQSIASDMLGRPGGPRLNDRGVALARKLADPKAECQFLYSAASEKAFSKTAADAGAAVDAVIAFADQYQLPLCRWQANLLRGYVPYNQGNYSEAMEWYTKSYRLAEAERNPLRMSLSLQAIGSLYGHPWSKAEELQKAVEYLKRALALADPLVYRRNAAGIYENLGLTHMRLKNSKEARQMLEKALQLAEGADATRVRYRLAMVAKDDGRYAEALELLDEAMPSLEKYTVQRFHAQALIARAEVLQRLGRREESLDALSEAGAAARRLDNREFDVIYLERAADVYSRVGDYPEAFRQMSLLRAAEKQLNDAAKAKQAEELKVRFDVQLKDAENARLRAQSKEAEAKGLALMLALALTFVLLGSIAFHLRRSAKTAANEAQRNRALAEAKSAFLANMSHELRSPLNAILGFTRLLLRDSSMQARAKHDLGIVLKSGEHLYTVINQVLDMSKIEAGQAALHEKNLDLYELLDELLESFELTASQHGLRLAIDSAPDVPKYIAADCVKLRQILINLLSNAFKFTREGDVVVKVTVAHPGPSCRLAFAVSDTGPGIAPEELKELGLAFVQAQAGRAASEGTGLGLAISRSFVQLMGGEFKIESEVGRGTTFSFEIPVRIVAATSIAVDLDRSRRAIRLASGQPRRRVLAADDREDSRKLLVRLLEPLGFEVREAVNGQEAVDICEAWRPHLILMDMLMPVMSGLEATRRIRAAEKDRKTVIVAITASSTEDERGAILAAGCDEYLRKPLREDVLLETIRRLLGLQYIYEEAAPVAAIQVDVTRVAALPPELRALLGDSLRHLDVAAIECAIDAIRLQDADLASALSEMAGRFEYGRMLEWIDSAGKF